MIGIVSEKNSQRKLTELCRAHFDTMVKFVVDIELGIIALGGEMHADAKAILLEHGSQQKHLWGGNFYPWNEPQHRLEYTSFINIRPLYDNMGMEILSAEIKQKVKNIVESMVFSPDEHMEAFT